jgi:hypothetical protein
MMVVTYLGMKRYVWNRRAKPFAISQQLDSFIGG